MNSAKHYLLLLFLISFIHLTCFTFIHAQEASFQGLGDGNKVWGVSADGFAVVGENNIYHWFSEGEAFLWLDSLRLDSLTVLPQRMITLGTLPGSGHSKAHCVIDSGRIVGGYCYGGGVDRAFYWTDSTGMIEIESIDDYGTRVYDGSADGTLAVGSLDHRQQIHTYHEILPEACLWEYPSTTMGLGYLHDPYPYSVAYAISSDGSTVVGWSVNSDTLSQAFRWTSLSGLVTIFPRNFL
jgi:uncharacterized membrane protein